MKNINTASNLAQLIVGLPNTLWSLPVFYEDCDCGNGPHPVNSLYPDRDSAGNIYLRPSREHYQVTDILAEYNRLKKDNDEIYKRVENARAQGVEVFNWESEPLGWNDAFKKDGIQARCDEDFDPNKQEDSEVIIARYHEALMEHLQRRSDDSVPVWSMFTVGYPGKRRYYRFMLENLDIKMKVIDSRRTEDDLMGNLLHMHLQFDIKFEWAPDTEHDTSWKDLGFKYNVRELYKVDKNLTFEIIKSNPT